MKLIFQCVHFYSTITTVPSEDLRSSPADWSVHTLRSETASSNSRPTLGYCRSYGKQDNWMFWEPQKLIQVTVLDKTSRWTEARVLALTRSILAPTTCAGGALLGSHNLGMQGQAQQLLRVPGYYGISTGFAETRTAALQASQQPQRSFLPL